MKHNSVLDVINWGKTRSAEMEASTMQSSELFVTTKAFVRKQALDLMLTPLILVVFSPLMFLIKLAIKIASPGPVFYRQMRLGKEAKPFRFYKFRSMYVNTDDAQHRSYVKNLIKAGNPYEIDENGKALFKISDDKTVTTVGKWTRKYSVDELPQLFNVLRGEMSLVGPRPSLLCEYEDYSDWHRKRLDGIPGITGPWQVGAKDRVSFEEMVKLDIHYLKNWSLWRDINIILRTIPVMLKGEGH